MTTVDDATAVAGRADDAVPAPADGAPVAPEAASTRGRRALLVLGLTAVVALPLFVALGALRTPRWSPLLDLAMTEMRVRDVGTRHTPLVGLLGRLSSDGEQGSHLGPAQLLAARPDLPGARQLGVGPPGRRGRPERHGDRDDAVDRAPTRRDGAGRRLRRRPGRAGARLRHDGADRAVEPVHAGAVVDAHAGGAVGRRRATTSRCCRWRSSRRRSACRPTSPTRAWSPASPSRPSRCSGCARCASGETARPSDG